MVDLNNMTNESYVERGYIAHVNGCAVFQYGVAWMGLLSFVQWLNSNNMSARNNNNGGGNNARN